MYYFFIVGSRAIGVLWLDEVVEYTMERRRDHQHELHYAADPYTISYHAPQSQQQGL